MCEQFEANGEETELVYEQISSQILSDKRLGYIVEEIEKRDNNIKMILQRYILSFKYASVCANIFCKKYLIWGVVLQAVGQ